VRVERLCQEFDVELDVWAYDLRPGIPPEGLPRDQVYRGSRYPLGYFDKLREMARESGIQMIAPPVVANTLKAHQATEFAKDRGRLREFHRAVFSACWERGENIDREDVLCRLARECGLDGDELRAALADARYARRVEEQIAWARSANLGGVPAFIFDQKFTLVGAQEYQVFADIARRIQRIS
jgi:predicted DsbA family dithiol-disulfide isomerase